MEAKMHTSDVENNGNNITINDPQAVAFKEFYHETLVKQSITQGKEAWAIGKSQTLVSQFLDPYSNRHLPVYLAGRSELGDDIIGWLAQQRGGHYTPKVGALNGTTKDELANILKASSIITACDNDPTVCSAQFEIIMNSAKRAMEECAK